MMIENDTIISMVMIMRTMKDKTPLEAFP